MTRFGPLRRPPPPNLPSVQGVSNIELLAHFVLFKVLLHSMCYVNVNDGEESNLTQDGRQSKREHPYTLPGKWAWEANYSIKCAFYL